MRMYAVILVVIYSISLLQWSDICDGYSSMFLRCVVTAHKIYPLPTTWLMTFNPFQSNFSANRMLPISYLFWAGKRLVDYL